MEIQWHPADLLTFFRIFPYQDKYPLKLKKMLQGLRSYRIHDWILLLKNQLFFWKSADIRLRYSKIFSLKKSSDKMTKTKLKGNFWNSKNVFLILKNHDIQKSKAEIFKYYKSKTEIVKHYLPSSFSSTSWVSSIGLVVKAVNFKSNVRGFKPPSGKNVILIFFSFFLTKINSFYIPSDK